MANKSYNTYTFGNDYETLQERFFWGLYAKYGEVKATQDNTKLVCFLSKVEGYSGSVLDIGVGETKTINKSDNLMYLFFHRIVLLEIQISQYDIKKLNSSSVEITNESETTARIMAYKR